MSLDHNGSVSRPRAFTACILTTLLLAVGGGERASAHDGLATGAPGQP